MSRGRAYRTYGAGQCALADPALAGWANLWRSSGACLKNTGTLNGRKSKWRFLGHPRRMPEEWYGRAFRI